MKMENYLQDTYYTKAYILGTIRQNIHLVEKWVKDIYSQFTKG